MRFRRSLVAVLAVLGLIATGCGSSSAGESVAAAEPAAPSEPSAADSGADEEPLVLSTVAGGQIDFGSLEGQDVVLWFWAPW